jgi:hypothetical protein
MAMSSKIDELPGSEEELKMQQQMSQDRESDQYQSNISNEQMQNDSGVQNIKMNVKKKVRFEDEDGMDNYLDDDYEETGVVASIKNEINEENILILGILFLASSEYINKYIYKLPVLGVKIIGNKLFFSLTKTVLVFLVFVLVKKFLLPRIKI